MNNNADNISALLTNLSTDINGLTIALTAVVEALLESGEIDKELMLKTIDKRCAQVSQLLLESNPNISSLDRILLDIRAAVSDHIKDS